MIKIDNETLYASISADWYINKPEGTYSLIRSKSMVLLFCYYGFNSITYEDPQYQQLLTIKKISDKQTIVIGENSLGVVSTILAKPNVDFLMQHDFDKPAILNGYNDKYYLYGTEVSEFQWKIIRKFPRFLVDHNSIYNFKFFLHYRFLTGFFAFLIYFTFFLFRGKK